MGQPVVHFEVVGKDGDKLKAYYSDLFGWGFEDAQGPMNYGVVQREHAWADDLPGREAGIVHRERRRVAHRLKREVAPGDQPAIQRG